MIGGTLLWVMIGLFIGAAVWEKIGEVRAQRRDRYRSVN